MLSFECRSQEAGEREVYVAGRPAFSLARVKRFPYNPVDLETPVDLRIRVPEFSYAPKLNLAQEAAK